MEVTGLQGDFNLVDCNEKISQFIYCFANDSVKTDRLNQKIGRLIFKVI